MRILIELPTWLGDAVMASTAVEAIAKHATAFDAENLTGKFEDLGERDFSFSSQNFGPVTQEIQIFKNGAANLSDKFDADGSANLTASARENQNLENLTAQPVKIVFFGSFAACELFKAHPNCERVIVDNSKKAKFRLWRLFWQAKNLGKFDAAFSFRSSFSSKILLFGARARRKFIFQKSKDGAHQVQKYLKFVKAALNLKRADDELKLYFEPRKFDAPVLGLNPGASYGSAKRWYPTYFAQVALHFKDYDFRRRGRARYVRADRANFTRKRRGVRKSSGQNERARALRDDRWHRTKRRNIYHKRQRPDAYRRSLQDAYDRAFWTDEIYTDLPVAQR